MFEFALGVVVALIMAMLGTHYYFKEKIKKNSEGKKDEYCKEMAKMQVDSVRSLAERPQPVPQMIPRQIIRPQQASSYNELEEFYFNLYKKQFDGLDALAEAPKLELSQQYNVLLSSGYSSLLAYWCLSIHFDIRLLSF